MGWEQSGRLPGGGGTCASFEGWVGFWQLRVCACVCVLVCMCVCVCKRRSERKSGRKERAGEISVRRQ